MLKPLPLRKIPHFKKIPLKRVHLPLTLALVTLLAIPASHSTTPHYSAPPLNSLLLSPQSTVSETVNCTAKPLFSAAAASTLRTRSWLRKPHRNRPKNILGSSTIKKMPFFRKLLLPHHLLTDFIHNTSKVFSSIQRPKYLYSCRIKTRSHPPVHP